MNAKILSQLNGSFLATSFKCIAESKNVRHRPRQTVGYIQEKQNN